MFEATVGDNMDHKTLMYYEWVRSNAVELDKGPGVQDELNIRH